MSEAPKHTEECKDAAAPPGHDAPGDAENAGDQRPKLTRASTSYYFRAKSQWVDRVSGLVVRRPFAILAWVFFALLIACGSLVAVGFGVSSETNYDWDVQDDVYTIRLAMVESAHDRTDREFIAERSDETYWWDYFYDTKAFRGKDTCDAPRGLFTARNVQLICRSEQELLKHKYEKFCVAPKSANTTCAPLQHSLAGFFYSQSVERLLESDCPLLSDARLDEVTKELYADPDKYGAYLDSGAFFGSRGYACLGRSMFPLATPLDGFEKVGKYDDGNKQYRKVTRSLQRANNQLQKFFNLKSKFFRSPLEEDARGGASGKRISVLWSSQNVQQQEFATALNNDFALVIFSFLFVWLWMRVHVGSCIVASFSMLQILVSLPLSLFIYRIVFWIPYFGPMQILVVFIILGIGADDVFVYSDAWHQSVEDVPREAGEAWPAHLKRRVAYAYSRALEAILNTSFTTAVAFFATATSSIMPISTFGIFAAICVLMNYGLVMICTPAIWIICTPATDEESADVDAAEEALEIEADEAVATRRGLRCGCEGRCAECPSVTTSMFERYISVVRRKPAALALVLGTLTAGVALAVCASRLTPPKEPEEWFPPEHMLTRTQKLESGNKYETNLAETYPGVSVYWGLDKLKRPNFSRYEPDKHRGDVKFTSPLELYTPDAQNQILFACSELGTARGGDLVRGGSVVCFMEEFQTWHFETYGTDTYGLDEATFNARLITFRENTTPTNDVNPTSSWERIIGVVDGQIRYVRVLARINARHDASVDRKHRLIKQTHDVVQATRRKPGLSGASIWHYSYTFVWYASQVALVDGLLFGMSLAFPVAFVVLCLATQNVILAFVAIITIGLIVASVLGTSFLMGWHLGIKESVAGVIVIGFSVDYTIHLGHMFDHARYEGIVGRADKFAFAVRKMGPTVLAGAITTAGSCSFLLACQLTFFSAMGQLIIMTVGYSLAYSLFFFMPLLSLAGPEDHTGNIMSAYRRVRKTCRRGEAADASSS